MKVIVTGGAGYIGSHTCKELAKAGIEAIAFDNLSTGHRDFIKWGPFEQGELADKLRLQQVFDKYKPDGVIHFAAFAYVGESVRNPGNYFRNNVVGTLNLLEAMRDSEVKNIVVSSTCAVYGIPKKLPISEDTPHNPISPYGASKMFMERMLPDFEAAHGIKWAALRYFNACGADPEKEIGELHDPETHLIPRVLMAANGDIPHLEVFGDDYPTPDGTCQRDYIHVADLASAHVATLTYLAQGGVSGAFNLGTGTTHSVKEILYAAEKVTGKTVPHKLCPRRLGDPPVLVASAEKARATLNWQPKFSSLEAILDTAWDWHLLRG